MFYAWDFVKGKKKGWKKHKIWNKQEEWRDWYNWDNIVYFKLFFLQ